MNTGLGSPKANLLIPDMAAFGLATQAVVATEPPASVYTGSTFGLSVDVEDSLGNVDGSYTNSALSTETATLTLSTGPAGVTVTPITTDVINGVAVFDGIDLSQTGGYKFQVSVSGTPPTSNVVDDRRRGDRARRTARRRLLPRSQLREFDHGHQ